MCAKSFPDAQRGISLIELIMFIVIVAMSLAGILLVMDRVTAHSADPLIRKQAIAIAESMLEEIQLQDLDLASCTGALGPDAPRTGVGCVDDYVGYRTNNGILAFSDNSQVGLDSYNITGITVTPVNPFGGTAVVAPHRAVMISVTVAHPLGETVTATGYRTN